MAYLSGFYRGCGEIRDRTTKTYPFDKLRAGSQGLKPSSARVVYGTAEAVPFVEICDDPSKRHD